MVTKVKIKLANGSVYSAKTKGKAVELAVKKLADKYAKGKSYEVITA